jgi:AcrR family transcriptional regulator
MAEKGTESGIPIPPWRTPPKPAPVKQPLSQELIVETALRILEAEGLDAVTMRRVAQELDTGPASLYAHVSNKEELQQLMLDRVAAEIELPEPDPERWQEQIKQFAINSQRVWVRYADIARVSLANIPTGPNQLRIAERMLAILRAGGVGEKAAGWALDRLALMIDADAIEAGIYRKKVAEGVDLEAYFGQIFEYFKSLPPDQFPHITSMIDSLTSGDGDERFEFGLDLFIKGLEAYVEK